MITGVVNAHLEATIRLPVQGPAGQQRDVEVIVDTGFIDSLTLPPSVIATLGLVWRFQASIRLADGSIQQIDIYTATVIWDGIPRSIEVEAIDAPPLLGTGLLVDHELRIQLRAGGSVTIEALP
jgi:clan AA aspartic protease